MRDRFGAQDPRSMMLRFHVQTAGSTLTAQQPDVNIVRTALQAMAAVLGGAQSLHTNSRDEAISLPSEESARIALRTQQIIAYETGVANTGRPGGRQRTHRAPQPIPSSADVWNTWIESTRWAGTLRAIESGFIQNEIQTAAYEYQRAVESGERVIVGVNRFRKDEGGGAPAFRLDPAVERAQVEKLRQVRASRSASAVEERLARLTAAARTESNLMPPILEAAEVYATVGEISDALRQVFGEHHES
jgi:methylmalonyl-CoA mutase N-terminal domain/subunit